MVLRKVGSELNKAAQCNRAVKNLEWREPIDFSFSFVFLSIPHPLLKPKKGNKSGETLEGTDDSDIGFCKANETVAAIFPPHIENWI